MTPYIKFHSSERISVIGSQFIPSLSNYKVFLLTNKLKEHSSVDFALLTSDGFVNRTIDINGKDTFDEVEFEVSFNTDFLIFNLRSCLGYILG